MASRVKTKSTTASTKTTTKSSGAENVSPQDADKMIDVLKAFQSYKIKTGDKEEIVLPSRVKQRAREWLAQTRTALKDKRSTVEFIHRMSVDDFNDFFVDANEEFEDVEEEVAKTKAKDEPPKAESSANQKKSDQKSERGRSRENTSAADDDNPFAAIGQGFGSLLGGMLSPMMNMAYSKEFLYPSCKAAVESYPVYLEKNKATLPSEDFLRYKKQADIYRRIVELFEKEINEDDAAAKSTRQRKVAMLMGEMQKLGDPPEEIRELQAENQPDMEDQFNTMMGGLGGMFGNMGRAAGGGSGNDDAECCIQ